MRVGDHTAMSSRAIDGGTPQEHAGHLTWPVLSGLIPLLADSYTPRSETGLSLAGSLSPGETAVLVTADDAARALGGLGGTGKTQLAAAIAQTLWDQHAVDLLVWVTASGRDAVLTSYAQANADVGAPDPGEGPERAASNFLTWLTQTSRPWLAVLDDLTDPAVLDGLWPWGPGGRVIVTTNRPDTALRARSPRVVEVGAFSRREALGFLSAKLQADPDQWIGALDLASELGFLPIALAQAGALMADTGIDCREYRNRIAERRRQLLGPPGGTHSSTVVATGALALELADRLPPAGLARPVLALMAMLDPNGIPGAVLTSQATCAFLTRVRGATPVDEVQARTAVHNLARVGLVSIDTTSAARTVRVHALVQAGARHSLSAAEGDLAARTAADAVLQAWPRRGVPPAFDQALRDCTARLREIAGALLWSPECHPVLLRAGRSLDSAGLAGPAVTYWQMMTDLGRPTLGAGHAHTIFARGRLAAAYEATGRLDEAIPIYERALAERERGLGPAHPDTLISRSSLARAYRAAARSADAVRLAERMLADSERANGPLHPDTLAARTELGHAYLSAGLWQPAVTVFEQTIEGREQVLGPAHPDTLTARENLALAYRPAGRLEDAIPLYERTLADREKVLGADHPDTIMTRGHLASAYRAADRLKDALLLYKRTLADRERVQGRDHPDTMTARSNLADAYHSARKLKEALPLYERTLADRERVQGPAHPDTITARGNLASAYHSARKLAAAIPMYERTLADCERVLGPEHPNTLASRGNLAHAYHTAGRHAEALAVFERTLEDSERALGPEHPLTRTARENYEAARN
jgi:tetratricopeptide (TPR) repeat protein